jgi:hypothetical protein
MGAWADGELDEGDYPARRLRARILPIESR